MIYQGVMLSAAAETPGKIHYYRGLPLNPFEFRLRRVRPPSTAKLARLQPAIQVEPVTEYFEEIQLRGVNFGLVALCSITLGFL